MLKKFLVVVFILGIISCSKELSTNPKNSNSSSSNGIETNNSSINTNGTNGGGSTDNNGSSPAPPPITPPVVTPNYQFFYLENVNKKVRVNVNNYWEDNIDLNSIYRVLVANNSIARTFVGTSISKKRFLFDENLNIVRDGVIYKKYIKSVLVRARDDSTPLFNGKYALGAVYEVVTKVGYSPEVGKLEILVLNPRAEVWVQGPKYPSFSHYDASSLDINTASTDYNPDNIYTQKYPILGPRYSESYEWVLFTRSPNELEWE